VPIARITRPTRRLLAIAGLAVLVVSGCQGPSESEQTGMHGRAGAVADADGSTASPIAATTRGARA
jgi:hypothetical protein